MAVYTFMLYVFKISFSVAYSVMCVQMKRTQILGATSPGRLVV